MADVDFKRRLGPCDLRGISDEHFGFENDFQDTARRAGAKASSSDAGRNTRLDTVNRNVRGANGIWVPCTLTRSLQLNYLFTNPS